MIQLYTIKPVVLLYRLKRHRIYILAKIFRGSICSKPEPEHLPNSFEHLDTSFEHLPKSFEHLDGLLTIAEPVRTVKKASKQLVESTIMEICSDRHLTLEELSKLLNRSKDSLRNNCINPMLRDGRLEQKHNNITTHPNQKYRSVERAEDREINE